MARLTEEEKQEFLRVTAMAARSAETEPAADPGGESLRHSLTPREYVEFATFASLFDRSIKPVAFGGEHWLL